jgi:hypothetical protein
VSLSVTPAAIAEVKEGCSERRARAFYLVTVEPSRRSSFLKLEPQAGDGFGSGFRKATLIIIRIGEPPVMLFMKRDKIPSTRLYEFFEGGDDLTWLF